MMNPHIIDHPSLSDFLASTCFDQHDNVRLNLLYGSLLQGINESERSKGAKPSEAELVEEKPDSNSQILVSVWQDDELRLLFTKIGTGQSRIGSPLPPSQLDTLSIPLLPTLISHLLSLPVFSNSLNAPSLLRTLVGSELLFLPFLSLWPHPSEPQPNLYIHACSIRRPPAIPPLPEGHSVSLVKFSNLSSSDLEGISNLIIGFLLGHPRSKALTLDQAKENVRRQALNGMWVYRGRTDSSNGSIVPLGLVNLGRPTPNTIAIRGVYVSPEARGQGIAERMVGSVVKTYLLDSKPIEYDSTFRSSPPQLDAETMYGRKKEVCLFVKVDGDVARRLYKRIGFEESEDAWGDFDLKGVGSGAWQ